MNIAFAIQNDSKATLLVGISGQDSRSTNLKDAILTTRDGMRYKPVRTLSSFGLRLVASRDLNAYPVLHSLPSGFRVLGESLDTAVGQPAQASTLLFKVPDTSVGYDELTLPDPPQPTARDDSIRTLQRTLTGLFEPLDLSAVPFGARAVQFPTDRPSTDFLEPGVVASVPGRLTFTLLTASVAKPEEYNVRDAKVVVLRYRLRNEDAQQARAFNISAKLFGSDGVVYTSSLPTSSPAALSGVPEPHTLLAWDGRSLGGDSLPSQQDAEYERPLFRVPAALTNARMMIEGDVQAIYNLTNLGVP